MTSETERKLTVSLDRLFLATDNPRHEEVGDEGAAIARLCRTENIDQLAADIARYGINPAERLIVIPLDEEDEIGEDTNYIVGEGNRRVCALKLLSDPDLAPADIRGRISKYARDWTPVSEVDVVVILDDERRRHWLLRIHDGVQGGRGRKPWTSEQKTRFTGSGRNVLAQLAFDYAEKRGLLQSGERKGRISHMARLLGNPLVKDALGLATSDEADGLLRTRPQSEFDLVLKELLEECRTKSLGSQAKNDVINPFAHRLQQLQGISGERIDPTPVESDETREAEAEAEEKEESERKNKPSKQPKPPHQASQLVWSEQISEALHEANCQKLSALYWSICSVNSRRHAPLVAVGVWSFLESLAATCGAKNQPFKDFWNKGKLSQMNVAKGDPAKAMNEALTRLAQAGNTTKHDAISGHFDSQQLTNDWTKIQPLVVAAVKSIPKNG